MSAPENPLAFPAVPGFDEALLAKFVARVDGGDWSLDQCWNWTGHKTAKGYGVFAPEKRRQYRAHRFALHAYLGREPQGLVLHECDNPACVNPKHLSEGTHKQNMSQMAERRRAARGPRHPKAKLTQSKAIAINLLHREGDFSTRELAAMFAMHQSTVAAITKGDLWPDAYSAATRALREAPIETLRDRFAGQALISLATQHHGNDWGPSGKGHGPICACKAYALADAMLAEREKGGAA